MSSKEELEVLKRRALIFLDTAKYLSSKKGAYDLACFNAEQAAQLYCKAALLESIGDFPRTHSTIDLITSLSDIHSSSPDMKRFIEDNREALKLLETVYITSRYFAIRFTKEDAGKLLAIAERVMRFVDEIRKTTKKSPDSS